MRIAGLSLIALGMLAAAEPPSPPSLPVKTGGNGYAISRYMRIDAGHNLVVRNGNLRGMILFAFNLRPYQLDGGPAWIDSETFDITAPLTGSDFDGPHPDLQAFLIERFGLKFHREDRPAPVYALKAVHNGEGVRGVWLGLATPSTTGRTLARFATDLARSLDRPVLDSTTLPGAWDLMPDSGTFPIPAIVPPDIGLQLESQPGTVNVLVIDSAARPAP